MSLSCWISDTPICDTLSIISVRYQTQWFKWTQLDVLVCRVGYETHLQSDVSDYGNKEAMKLMIMSKENNRELTFE